MSERQAEGAVLTVANGLFGREWKTYDKTREVIDSNCLPGSNENLINLFYFTHKYFTFFY